MTVMRGATARARARRPATLSALQEWADDYVREWVDRLGGCKVGAIAAWRRGALVKIDLACRV